MKSITQRKRVLKRILVYLSLIVVAIFASLIMARVWLSHVPVEISGSQRAEEVFEDHDQWKSVPDHKIPLVLQQLGLPRDLNLLELDLAYVEDHDYVVAVRIAIKHRDAPELESTWMSQAEAEPMHSEGIVDPSELLGPAAQHLSGRVSQAYFEKHMPELRGFSAAERFDGPRGQVEYLITQAGITWALDDEFLKLMGLGTHGPNHRYRVPVMRLFKYP